MVFASLEFLTIFFPLFFCAYSFSPTKWRNFTLLIFSWIFYAWWSPAFLWVLIVVTIVVWGTGLALVRVQQERLRKALVALSVVALAGLLAFYKYANLLFESLIQPLCAAMGHSFAWERLTLPIGISFIVLQGISYIVDVYRGAVHPEYDCIAFAAYKAMFSQLIAGPIVRYAHVEQELHSRPFDIQHIASGLRFFMIGLSMKVIIADTLAPLVDACFVVSQPTMADVWLGAYAYGMQLFFDFAGYSTMAIGIGRMLGFCFPENFSAPYISRSIQEFWRRWHMTLGSWLRDYLYIPLGGSRVSARRMYLNLMLVMAVSGLWHGADSLNFLLWGLLHGLAMVIQRFWDRYSGLNLPAPVAWTLTMIFVFSAWILFRAPNLTSAWVMYQGLLGIYGYALSTEVAAVLRPVHVLTCLLASFAATYTVWRDWMIRIVTIPNVFWAILTLWPLPAFLLAVALLASRGSTPFLYFQF